MGRPEQSEEVLSGVDRGKQLEREQWVELSLRSLMSTDLNMN